QTKSAHENSTHPPEPLSLASQPAATQPASRSLPSPFESPPFPYSDFLGPTIGTPDSTPGWPLQKALKNTRFGKVMDDQRIKYYGWVSPSFNWSTSKFSNTPTAYPLDPNRIVLDQVVGVIERPLDTVQTDHIDWGFHVLSLYGIDYRYMLMKGFFSRQLLQ